MIKCIHDESNSKALRCSTVAVHANETGHTCPLWSIQPGRPMNDVQSGAHPAFFNGSSAERTSEQALPELSLVVASSHLLDRVS